MFQLKKKKSHSVDHKDCLTLLLQNLYVGKLVVRYTDAALEMKKKDPKHKYQD